MVRDQEDLTQFAGIGDAIASDIREIVTTGSEEEIFYPAVRKHVGKDPMNEADEEHHVARLLIAELDRDGRGNDHRDAKFTVLAESVKHHFKEEESEMLLKAKAVEMDFEALGQQMLERRRQLKRDGIPSDAEHAMVAAAKGGDDTPAAAASYFAFHNRFGALRSFAAAQPAAHQATARVYCSFRGSRRSSPVETNGRAGPMSRG
jgi:hypothetical protein